MGSSWYWLGCGIAVAFVLDSANSLRSYEPAEVMSHAAAHFGRALEECRGESGLTKETMEEFKIFWSEDFEVVHREMGCALICMSNKFSLLQEDARMHHANMNDYILSFPEGLDFTDKILDYWKRDYVLNDTNLGCLLMCSLLKLKLLHENGQLHEANVKGFITASGADEIMVPVIIGVYKKCHRSARRITKTCTLGLELMKCFRANIYQLNWVPDVKF